MPGPRLGTPVDDDLVGSRMAIGSLDGHPGTAVFAGELADVFRPHDHRLLARLADNPGPVGKLVRHGEDGQGMASRGLIRSSGRAVG